MNIPQVIASVEYFYFGSLKAWKKNLQSIISIKKNCIAEN